MLLLLFDRSFEKFNWNFDIIHAVDEKLTKKAGNGSVYFSHLSLSLFYCRYKTLCFNQTSSSFVVGASNSLHVRLRFFQTWRWWRRWKRCWWSGKPRKIVCLEGWNREFMRNLQLTLMSTNKNRDFMISEKKRDDMRSAQIYVHTRRSEL